MGITRVAAPIDIAVSGLRAQNARLSVIGNNIANADTTRAADGKPYRRQQVVLGTGGGVQGVQVQQTVSDNTPFPRVYEPGNPDADKDGYMETPNVQLPVEMMHMLQANQAYQANAAVLKRYLDAMDVTAELLK
jgi:flagellar basal-body rod protein FlgC